MQKMSLASITGKLSRAEMKKIMAGSGAGCGTACNTTCTHSDGRAGNCHMPTEGPNMGKCFCVSGY